MEASNSDICTITAGSSYLSHRSTPWDTVALGLQTDEITDIIYSNMDELRELINQYNEYVQINEIELSYVRVSAGDISIKGVLQSNGFYYAESSIEMRSSNLKRFVPKPKYSKKLELIRVVEESVIDQIREIADRAFNHSRFHEDGNIETSKARLRFRNWVDDLLAHDYEVLAFTTEGIVHAFMAYEIKGNQARLVLGGSDVDKGYLSPFLWSTILTKLSENGITTAVGLVSTGNIAIINMYFELGFTISKTYNGFHRLSKKGS